jgi:hypothetical protein
MTKTNIFILGPLTYYSCAYAVLSRLRGLAISLLFFHNLFILHDYWKLRQIEQALLVCLRDKPRTLFLYLKNRTIYLCTVITARVY